MAKLLVHETAGVREFELMDPEVRVGRELDNALRLSDPSISRHHAIIRKQEAGYEVEDLGSSNGVLVNGLRAQKAFLKDGDRLTLGQVHLTFVEPAPMPASPLGTVRLNLEDMAKIQAAQAAAAEPAPESVAAAEATPAPVAEATPARVPAVEPPAAAVPAPAAAEADHVPPVAPMPASRVPVPQAPDANPLPEGLRGFFPPVPDDAQPTGERGDFVTRLLAYLVDCAIGMAFGIVLGILAIVPILNCLLALVAPLLGLAFAAATVWCWIRFGATPGKKLMRLRVVPEEDPNGRIDVGQGVLRLLGHMVNGMLAGLPYLMILGGERKGLQDLFSRSIVIKVDR